MQPKEIYLQLVKAFPDSPITFKEAGEEIRPGVKTAGEPFVIIPKELVLKVLEMFRLLETFSFDSLMSLTAVDFKDRIEVVYHLFSYRRLHRLTLKVYLERKDPMEMPSVEGIWKTANWLEREVYDLFGISFTGHSNLKRIMLPDDWIGYPLRKDYKEQEQYQGMETTREFPLDT